MEIEKKIISEYVERFSIYIGKKIYMMLFLF